LLSEFFTHHTLGAEEELKTFGEILTSCTLNGCNGFLMGNWRLVFAQIIDYTQFMNVKIG
jgi:hypothetical protein